MAAPISSLPKRERQQLFHDLNYLNTAQIKQFCQQHAIPYRIAVETARGRRRTTSEDDRKGVMLERIRHYLQTGKIAKQTCLTASVVCFDSIPETLSADDRLFYGWYDKKNHALMALLNELTGGNFRDGAIARILLRDFWTRRKAPTFREFACAWLEASRMHTAPNPEWAFLSDRSRNMATANWKKMRAKKAASVLKILRQIAPSPRNSRRFPASI